MESQASNDEIAREAWRQQALRTLGVANLVPRFILPGAAPSPRGATLATVAVVPNPSVSAGAREKPADAPVVVSRGASGQRAMSAVSQQDAVERKPSPVRAPSRTTVPMSLTLCRAEEWLMIEVGGAPSALYLRLLANVLHACGQAGRRIEPEHFQWPPVHRPPPQLDTSEEAGQQVLYSRLQVLHERQPLRRLLIFGRAASHLLAKDIGIAGLQQLTVQAGLWSALQQPEVKQRLWRELADAGWL